MAVPLVHKSTAAIVSDSDGDMIWKKSRTFRLVAALIAMGLTAGPAQANETPRMMTPDQAPRSWMDYASLVNQEVTKWIGGDESAAVSLRLALDAARPAPDKPGASLSLRLWISSRGVISRLDHDPIEQGGGAAALCTLLTGKAIGKPPPRHMLLPLRLRLEAVRPAQFPKGETIRRTAIAAPVHYWGRDREAVRFGHIGVTARK